MKFFSKASIFSACLCGLALLLAGCGEEEKGRDPVIEKLASYMPSSNQVVIYGNISGALNAPLFCELTDTALFKEPVYKLIGSWDGDLRIMASFDIENPDPPFGSYLFLYSSTAANLDELLEELVKTAVKLTNRSEEVVDADLRTVIGKITLDDGTEALITLKAETPERKTLIIINPDPHIFIITTSDYLAQYRLLPEEAVGLPESRYSVLLNGHSDLLAYAGIDVENITIDYLSGISTADELYLKAKIISSTDMAQIISAIYMVQGLWGMQVMEQFSDDQDLANSLLKAFNFEQKGLDEVSASLVLTKSQLKEMIEFLRERSENDINKKLSGLMGKMKYLPANDLIIEEEPAPADDTSSTQQ